MKLVRCGFNLATVSDRGNYVECENDGEKIKSADDLRRAIEEAIKIAFPEGVA